MTHMGLSESQLCDNHSLNRDTEVRDLEGLVPLAHIIGKPPILFTFAFLNSYALELSESGQG